MSRARTAPDVSAEQVADWLKSRRSIRAYRETLVDRPLIEQALETARFAPSGHNRQPVSWIVVSGRDKISLLASAVIEWMRNAVAGGHPAAARLGFEGLVRRWDQGDDQICRNAPHLLLAHGPQSDTIAPGSCIIAVTYLQLAAAGLGLGTCWAGYVMIAMGLEPAFAKLIGLPEGQQVYGATLLGHARYKYHAIPARNELRVEWR